MPDLLCVCGVIRGMCGSKCVASVWCGVWHVREGVLHACGAVCWVVGGWL